jgi:hypothetical protein
MTEPTAGQTVEPVHLENLRFSRVLRTRDRLVRSGRHFIRCLLVIGQASSAPEPFPKPVKTAWG